MNELLSACIGGVVGGCIAVLCQQHGLRRYFDLVEQLWTNDLDGIDRRIDALSRIKER